MDLTLIDGYTIRFKPWDKRYLENLLTYFDRLSLNTKKRFAPHPFTRGDLISISGDPDYKLFIAVPEGLNNIVAYTIIKTGWIDEDVPRLTSYGLTPSKDCAVAPSVADAWQSRGIGSKFFKYVIGQVKSMDDINRMLLWGGVQLDNYKAVNFYKKIGFKTLGEFEYNGNNLDMILEF